MFRRAHPGIGEGRGGRETEDSSQGEKTTTQEQRGLPGEREWRTKLVCLKTLTGSYYMKESPETLHCQKCCSGSNLFSVSVGKN